MDGRALRERSYEALFYLAGAPALGLRSTLDGAFEPERIVGRYFVRSRELEAFREAGLVADGEGGLLRLTDLGRRALAGGRNPEEAWNRGWDGRWRLVAFDLPRDARAVRARFWRWLRANHFGQFQGSVWLSPDPVPEIREAARDSGLDVSMLVVFTGKVDGQKKPREIAAEAWDFQAINANLQDYMGFAEDSHLRIKDQPPSPAGLKALVREDRKLWWQAVRHDPLLPDSLHPRGYRGPAAWKLRQKLHAALFRSVEAGRSEQSRPAGARNR